MAIEEGKRVSCRWNQTRFRLLQDLGWTELDESTALTRAFRKAKELEELREAYKDFESGDINLAQLLNKIGG